MIKHGIIPKLVNLLKTPSFRAKTLKLLYHLSVEDRCKSMITYTDGVNILMGMVVNFPQPLLAKELAAVMVNLSYNTRNVELIIGNRGLNYLMDRLSSTRDPLLLKIIRNVSLWTFNQQQVSDDFYYYYLIFVLHLTNTVFSHRNWSHLKHSIDIVAFGRPILRFSLK